MKRKTLQEIVPSILGKQEYRVHHVDKPLAPLPGLVSYTCLSDAPTPFYSRDGREKLLFDNGFRVLSYLPERQHWCLTCVYDTGKADVEWYIDITLENNLEGDTGWFDDVYLDVVVLPDGGILNLDEEELLRARSAGAISEELAVKAGIWRDNLIREWLSPENRERLCRFMWGELQWFEMKKYIDKQ